MTKTLKMNKEPKFEISVVCFVFFEKYITKYTAHFAPEQNLAIFFFLDSLSKQVKYTASQVGKKKEQFSPEGGKIGKGGNRPNWQKSRKERLGFRLTLIRDNPNPNPNLNLTCFLARFSPFPIFPS